MLTNFLWCIAFVIVLALGMIGRSEQCPTCREWRRRGNERDWGWMWLWCWIDYAEMPPRWYGPSAHDFARARVMYAPVGLNWAIALIRWTWRKLRVPPIAWINAGAENPH